MELDDPIDSNLWTQVQNVSHSNAEIYQRVFGCYPDNKMRTMLNIKELKEKA